MVVGDHLRRVVGPWVGVVNITEPHVHEWGPDQLWVGHGGPLDGDWLVRSCLDCNAFEIGPRSGGECLELIRDAFAK